MKQSWTVCGECGHLPLLLIVNNVTFYVILQSYVNEIKLLPKLHLLFIEKSNMQWYVLFKISWNCNIKFIDINHHGKCSKYLYVEILTNRRRRSQLFYKIIYKFVKKGLHCSCSFRCAKICEQLFYKKPLDCFLIKIFTK